MECLRVAPYSKWPQTRTAVANPFRLERNSPKEIQTLFLMCSGEQNYEKSCHIRRLLHNEVFDIFSYKRFLTYQKCFVIVLRLKAKLDFFYLFAMLVINKLVCFGDIWIRWEFLLFHNRRFRSLINLALIEWQGRTRIKNVKDDSKLIWYQPSNQNQRLCTFFRTMCSELRFRFCKFLVPFFYKNLRVN